MASIEVALHEGTGGGARSAINDFSIQVATVNGSGSQTANTVLMRAIFQMGIPVSGKNMFPSNIAGLPTWFTIRASKQRLHRPQEGSRLPGGDESGNRARRRDEARARRRRGLRRAAEAQRAAQRPALLPRPVRQAGGAGLPEAKLRKLVRNMIYDGVVAHLLSIEMEEVDKALVKQFGKRKAKAAELNWGASGRVSITPPRTSPRATPSASSA
jgi:2-oxoglutarate ferredoxin oxidoreductase subunit alpha